MLRLVIAFLVLVISSSAYGDLDLHPVHPDESVDSTYDERFSVSNSLESVKKIGSALDSFRMLTEASAGKVSEKTLRKIGNTDWDTQHLGFVNHVESVKGTILKQDYQIGKLKYELAQAKAKSGEISPADLAAIKKSHEKSEKKFQDYWNSLEIAD